jgi:hypothetical protein
MIAAAMMALVRGIYGICYACTINIAGLTFRQGQQRHPNGS